MNNTWHWIFLQLIEFSSILIVGIFEIHSFEVISISDQVNSEYRFSLFKKMDFCLVWYHWNIYEMIKYYVWYEQK